MEPAAKPLEKTRSPAGPCSPTTGASQQLRPRTQPLSKPSSSLGKESGPSKPSESWETAYVFAFIYKFTSLCHNLEIGLKLRVAQDVSFCHYFLIHHHHYFLLERLLEVDTRTAPSQSTDEPGADNSSREAREILTAILTAFHDNLKTAVASTWTRWLKSYIEDLVKHELRQPMLATLKWKENYIKARADGFWDLDWHEKVHLLRILVDHQLTYSAKIKSMIEEHHDKASGKPSKQLANLPTFPNPLIIKPLGVDRHSRIWWQIDDSPRIYGSGNPYKTENHWTVLSTTKAEYAELLSTLEVNPSLLSLQSSDPSGVTSDPHTIKQSSTKKLKIPSMFTSNRKKPAVQDQGLKSEWELRQTLAEVAQANIEAGEQRVQQLLKEAQRLEDLEARKQRRIALANAPKRDPDLTRSTPGFGVRSRLRSQLTKPDYVVDSDLIDRKLERALQQYEKSSTGGSDSGRKAKPTKRKRKERQNDSRESDSENSEYNTGQDVSVAGTSEDSETTEMDGAAQTGRPSRKRACGSKKISAPGERRSLRPMVAEEEPQPTESTWSRSKPSASSSNSEIIAGPSADSGEPNENVSVWSRGKLIYVAGNNKYACKSEVTSEKRNPTASTTHSLSVLQARLEAMVGDDDENVQSLKEDQTRHDVLTNHQAGKELEQVDPSLSNLFGTDPESSSAQVDGTNTKPAPEDEKCSAPSAPLVELLHEDPARIPSEADQAAHNQINHASPAGPIQHINTPVLSTTV
ncbi:hypothetical protein VP01_1806g1 [Puccinia sorghi]|uniref:WHIM1 domain-containing protein n=1 Tax=Puccinia sorghi TaxID=27349 RepID=A0A0L6VEB0_9BASI|nr:hypothetical protein VP01_1806g1 [Puccinia sorghi]